VGPSLPIEKSRGERPVRESAGKGNKQHHFLMSQSSVLKIVALFALLHLLCPVGLVNPIVIKGLLFFGSPGSPQCFPPEKPVTLSVQRINLFFKDTTQFNGFTQNEAAGMDEVIELELVCRVFFRIAGTALPFTKKLRV